MTKTNNLKEIYSRLRLFISLGFAFFLGVIEYLPFYIENRQIPFSEIWLSTIVWFVVYFGYWFVLINGVWYLESKYSIIDNRIIKVFPLHLLVILSLTFSNAALSAIHFYKNQQDRANTVHRVENSPVENPPGNNVQGNNVPTVNYPFTAIFFARFINSIPIVILIYSGVWGIGIGLNYYQMYQEKAIRASELETQLSHSQLQTLKAQLQPHFLFNTLNGIVGLIRNNENQAAIETITELSTLLRYVVENAGQEMVELKEEIEFNRLYLNLHQKRFSDRMQVTINIAPETLHLEVPNLILQPLVENAIVHGVAKSISHQKISIESKIERDVLKLTVINDAPGLKKGWEIKKGVGLSNTYSRLEKTFDKNFSFEIKNHENLCVIAEISLPIKNSK